MKAQMIITLGLAMLIIVAASVLIAIGVSTHQETVFDSNTLEWERESIPLGVTCRGYTEDFETRCDVIERSIRAFNQRVGFTLFEWNADKPQIFYVVGVPQSVSAITHNGRDDDGNLNHAGESATLHSRNGRAYRCDILESNWGDDQMLWVLSYHGAGHCVGLGHDPSDYSISVMREFQPDTDLGVSLGDLPSLTDSDREGIRDRYGPQ